MLNTLLFVLSCVGINHITTINNELTSDTKVKVKVIYVEEFDSKALSKFSDDMKEAHSTGQSIIPIVINSYGGSVYTLLAMVDIIKASKLPIATIAVGKVMSAGAVLFACGNEGMRYIGPYTSVMIHDVSSRSFGKVGDLKVDLAETERLNHILFGLLSESVKNPTEFFELVEKNKNTDIYLSPSQAMDLGFANHIGIPTIRTRIYHQTTLE